MADRGQSKWAVVHALYVLWVLGVCVGLSVVGEWVTLAVFSATAVALDAATTAVSDWLGRQGNRREQEK